eukprot:1792290-Prymnesium_polylepis.1
MVGGGYSEVGGGASSAVTGGSREAKKPLKSSERLPSTAAQTQTDARAVLPPPGCTLTPLYVYKTLYTS